MRAVKKFTRDATSNTRVLHDGLDELEVDIAQLPLEELLQHLDALAELVLLEALGDLRVAAMTWFSLPFEGGSRKKCKKRTARRPREWSSSGD
jgi:hypothetical protein